MRSWGSASRTAWAGPRALAGLLHHPEGDGFGPLVGGQAPAEGSPLADALPATSPSDTVPLLGLDGQPAQLIQGGPGAARGGTNYLFPAFESDTIDKLNKLLEIYKDSITLWADLIDANSNPSLQLNADHIIFGFYPRTANITQKYNLPVIKDNSFFSGPDSLYGPGARSTLWNNASSLIETIQASIQ